ncbi:MAG: CBS domain-containing protein [Bacteroidales bacterium]|nr:CBS domain-containing protein [Bacteroidales bacterium]
MLAKDLLSGDILPLSPMDTGLTALHLFDELKVSHLPVVSGNEYIGLVSEEEIYSANKFEELIEQQGLNYKKISVVNSQHAYMVIRSFADNKLSLLPVVDESGLYLGCITMSGLIENLASITAVDNPGGIIVLEINVNDFSLTEIAQIIESNDARLLSLYMMSQPDSLRSEITLKLDRMNIQPIIQTFLRFNYTVKASFFENDYNDSLRDRYNMLMNYLNI